jgi:hypothetical protein
MLLLIIDCLAINKYIFKAPQAIQIHTYLDNREVKSALSDHRPYNLSIIFVVAGGGLFS